MPTYGNYGNYGIDVDPELLRRAKQGPGFMGNPLAFVDHSPGVAASQPIAKPVQTIASPALDQPGLPDMAAANQRSQGILANLPTIDAGIAARQSGSSLVDVMPAGVNPGQRAVVADSRSLGMGQLAQPRSSGISAPPTVEQPIALAAGSPQVMGGALQAGNVPLYQTDYAVYGQNGKQGTMSMTGANPRAGGGTLSILSGIDSAQKTATAENVANLNAQTEALRSLREARNPGVTTSSSASGIGDLPKFDPFARAGDGFGDSQMRAAQFDSMLKQAGSTGVSGKQRMALIDGAQGLVAPGIAAMGQLGGLAQHQMTNQTGILKGLMDAQQADKELQANKTHWGQQDALARDQSIAQQQHWNQQLGLERDKNASDLALGQERNQIARDAALNKAKPPSEYDKTLQRAQAKQQASQVQNQKTMGGTLNESFMKFDRLNELTNISGLFGPALAAGSKLVGGDRAAKAEEFNALANNMILDVTERMKGALSDKDIQFVKENMPGLSNTPQGNRQIMNNLRSFLLQKAKASGMDMGQVINQRGATLASKGLSQDQIVEQLRQEFAGVH